MAPRFDIGKIDDVIHGRLRLGVMAYLANAEVADFNELKAVLEVTQGNLSVQLRKLEDAGYVTIEKGFLGRKPRTQVRISAAGRAAFAAYLEALGQVIGQSPAA
ncbi:MAG TPA: transcriptional regulator [Phenylobacterium sp.]|nr:transcriptional regulator [Phenylobacterium sp.]